VSLLSLSTIYLIAGKSRAGLLHFKERCFASAMQVRLLYLRHSIADATVWRVRILNAALITQSRPILALACPFPCPFLMALPVNCLFHPAPRLLVCHFSHLFLFPHLALSRQAPNPRSTLPRSFSCTHSLLTPVSSFLSPSYPLQRRVISR